MTFFDAMAPTPEGSAKIMLEDAARIAELERQVTAQRREIEALYGQAVKPSRYQAVAGEGWTYGFRAQIGSYKEDFPTEAEARDAVRAACGLEGT